MILKNSALMFYFSLLHLLIWTKQNSRPHMYSSCVHAKMSKRLFTDPSILSWILTLVNLATISWWKFFTKSAFLHCFMPVKLRLCVLGIWPNLTLPWMMLYKRFLVFPIDKEWGKRVHFSITSLWLRFLQKDKQTFFEVYLLWRMLL